VLDVEEIEKKFNKEQNWNHHAAIVEILLVVL
jgi:hypothetical protein